MNVLGLFDHLSFEKRQPQKKCLLSVSLKKKISLIVVLYGKPGPLCEFRFSGKMLWIFCYFLVCVSFTNLVAAEDQCRSEVNIRGMALKGFVFKRMTVTAPHICDILCEREIICQSYNFNRKEKICELNNRTKHARPRNFRSVEPAWFHIRRLNGRGKEHDQAYKIITIDILATLPTLP